MALDGQQASPGKHLHRLEAELEFASDLAPEANASTSSKAWRKDAGFNMLKSTLLRRGGRKESEVMDNSGTFERAMASKIYLYSLTT